MIKYYRDTTPMICVFLLLMGLMSCSSSQKATNKYSDVDVILVDTLLNELSKSRSESCTTQACKACRQDARYEFSSCLRTASNDEQIKDCRNDHVVRLAECVD